MENALDRDRSPGKRGPFAPAEVSAQDFATLHEARVQAETGTIEEQPTVDPPDVHAHHAPAAHVRDSRLDLERNAEILREVIERAERKHAEWHARPQHRARDRIHGSVATAGDDGIGIRLHCTPRHVADIGAASCQMDARLHPMRREMVLEFLGRIRILYASGAGVDDNLRARSGFLDGDHGGV